MIKFLITPFVLILSGLVQANSVQEIQSLTSMMPNVCYFSGTFSQSKQVSTLPIPLNSFGEFIYSCEQGLIWKTNKPIDETLILTNKNQHFLIAGKNTKENLEGLQHDFLAKLLLGLMAGKTEFITDEFELLNKLDTPNLLTLTPKNKMVRQAIQSVTLKKLNNKNALEINIIDKHQQTTKIVSAETQQFVSKDKFFEICSTLFSNSCELLENPIQIKTSGKN